MANLNAPDKGKSYDGEWKTPDEDLYECYVSSIEEVPNKFYNPAVDNDTKKTQFLWTIKIRPDELEDAEDGSFKWSRTMRLYTGTSLGWHPKNKLVGTLRDVYKDFVYDPDGNGGKGEMTGFDSVEDLNGKVAGSSLRVMTTNTHKTVEGEERIYVNIKGIMKSKRDKIDMAELLRDSLGGTVTNGDDIPY